MATENNNKNLNVPNLRFPEFSEEWEHVALSEIAARVTRKNKDNASKLPLTISAQYGLVDQISFFNKVVASADMSNYYLLRQGEFAYNKSYSSDYPWGAIKRLDGYPQGALSSLYICFAVNDKVDSDFAVHYFESSKWHREVSNIAGEGARNHGLLNIAVGDFFDTKHRLPSSKEEQKKIAALLNLITERIATQIKIIEKLESLIKGLTDDVFCCNGNIPMVRFSNLYKDAGEGGTPSTSTLEYYEGGTIPFVKIDDLTAKYLVAHKDCITEQGMQKSSAWLIPPGSVIYSNGATIGSISINTYPICTKQGILGIIPKDNVNVEYLYYLMTSVYFRKEIHRIITEGTMKTAYLKDINNILCPIPDIDNQKLIANKLASITEKIELEQQVLSLLQAQKHYLLSNLFI